MMMICLINLDIICIDIWSYLTHPGPSILKNYAALGPRFSKICIGLEILQDIFFNQLRYNHLLIMSLIMLRKKSLFCDNNKEKTAHKYYLFIVGMIGRMTGMQTNVYLVVYPHCATIMA